MNLRLLLLLTILYSTASMAFIPDAKMVFSRWNKRQGSRDWYFISKTTSIKQKTDTSSALKFTEKWWKGPDISYVQVTQQAKPQFKLNFLYKNNEKIWVDSQKIKQKKKGSFIESYFSKEALRPKWFGEVKEVKLDRSQGVVTYFIRHQDKKLWIEQDDFLIRKVEISPDNFFTALNFVQASGGFFIPKDRLFYSKDYQVHIKVDRLSPIQAPQKIKVTQNEWDLSDISSNMGLIQYFYKNIR